MRNPALPCLWYRRQQEDCAPTLFPFSHQLQSVCCGGDLVDSAQERSSYHSREFLHTPKQTFQGKCWVNLPCFWSLREISSLLCFLENNSLPYSRSGCQVCLPKLCFHHYLTNCSTEQNLSGSYKLTDNLRVIILQQCPPTISSLHLLQANILGVQLLVHLGDANDFKGLGTNHSICLQQHELAQHSTGCSA